MRSYKGPIVLGSAVALVVLYHADTIQGQRKFDRLCETEAGARIYARVEKDVGWLVDESPASQGKSYAHTAPFSFGHVPFVRLKKRDGELVDVYRDPDYGSRPYPKDPNSEYRFEPADESKPVRYKYVLESRSPYQGDERFSRLQDRITDLATGQVIASMTQFFYQWTKPERVILNAGTSQSCNITREDVVEFQRAIFTYLAKP